ncbi:MAG: beta-phosphoglucomutase family hydrolase [Marmoricola sp.]
MTAGSGRTGALGLPGMIQGCLFDLDGVLTDTACVHARAWKQAFDELLAGRGDGSLPPFDELEDYRRHVDGKPRLDGVRDFLASRSITLLEGSPGDAPGDETVHGVGNAKNQILGERIRRDGVSVYDGSRRYLQAACEAGLRRAVVSSSANTEQVLQVTGLDALIELRIDGVVARERQLPGKPKPDTFLAAAEELGLPPEQCAVFEDAEVGVQAGRADGFGHVVGVDRTGHAQALREHGADVVVTDLAELL